MRQIFFAWTYSFFLLFGQGNPVQSFYNLIHQDHIVRMEIEFFQKQGVLAFPTETFYALGCRADLDQSVK